MIGRAENRGLASGPATRASMDFSLPAINIILLLLFFFIVAGTVAAREEARTAPPVTADLPLERLPRPLLLLADDGSLWLDGATLARAELVDAARARSTAGGRERPVNVLAPEWMAASTFLDIVGDLRGAGLSVRIVTLDIRALE